MERRVKHVTRGTTRNAGVCTHNYGIFIYNNVYQVSKGRMFKTSLNVTCKVISRFSSRLLHVHVVGASAPNFPKFILLNLPIMSK